MSRTISTLIASNLVLALLGKPVTVLAHSNVAYAGPGGLATTNGNKAVVDPSTNTIHVAYDAAGGIFYTSSADTHSMTTPVVVSGSITDVAEPAIAVDGSGTVGIIFVGAASSSSPQLWYVYKTGITWSTPMNIAGGRKPTMVGYGTAMHLAFIPMGMPASGILYWTFGSTSPVVWSYSGANQVDDIILCGETQHFFAPSIAVSGPTATPIVQVAYFKRVDMRTSICFPGNIIYLEMHVRRRDGFSMWPDQYIDARSQTPCSPANGFVGISASLSSDASGQYFVAWSDVYADTSCPGVANPRTAIARMDALGAWTPTTVLASTRSYVDVSSRSVGAGIANVRVTWAETTNFNATPIYSTTALVRQRSAIWTGAAGANPTPTFTTFLNLTSNAREPQSTWWSVGSCEIPAVVDRFTPATTTYRVHLWSVSLACIHPLVAGPVVPRGSGVGLFDYALRSDVLVPAGDSVLVSHVSRATALVLLVFLESADAHVQAGRERQAVNALDNFIDFVGRQPEERIARDEGEEMIARASEAIARIEDVCAIDNGGCSPDATCAPGATLGTAACSCNAGFDGDGINCFACRGGRCGP